MEREWRAIVQRYGQQVKVCQKQGEEALHAKAFLQPVREKGEFPLSPSPLGLQREERLLYLGVSNLQLFPGESTVIWKEVSYEVQSVHPVNGGCHWWAMLRRLDGEAA